MTITLRQLRYLSALARYRHFGRAADACAVSQPALSMQIRDLERSLGADMVERRPSDVVLTEVGAAVAARADAILTAVNDLVDVARHHTQTLVGRLRLGVIPTIAPYVCRTSCRSSSNAIRNCVWRCGKPRHRCCSTNSQTARSTPRCWRCRWTTSTSKRVP